MPPSSHRSPTMSSLSRMASSSRTQVARAVAQLHEGLNIILTDSDQPENMWAIVPRCKRFKLDDSTHICADNDGSWDHKTRPTIFVNLTLDRLLSGMDISQEERHHLLLKGFGIAIHDSELGHLLLRYVSSDFKFGVRHHIK
jgi:hypothetical protein